MSIVIVVSRALSTAVLSIDGRPVSSTLKMARGIVLRALVNNTGCGGDRRDIPSGLIILLFGRTGFEVAILTYFDSLFRFGDSEYRKSYL